MENACAYFGLTLAMVLWGASFVATKIAVSVYHPFTVIFGRMTIASLIFLLLWKRVKPDSLERGDLKYLVLMALMEPCLYFIFEGYALKYTTAGQAALIVSTLPLMVGISAAMFLNEELKLKTVLGFILSILGVFILTWSADISQNSPNPLMGNVLEFLAMVMATGYTLIVRYLSSRYHALFLTAVQSFVGAIFFLPLMVSTCELSELKIHISAVYSIVFLGVFVTVLAYWLYNYGIAKISAAKAAAFGNMIPVFTLLIGWIMLDEVLNPTQIGASFLIACGIVISQDVSFVSFYRVMSDKLGFLKYGVK